MGWVMGWDGYPGGVRYIANYCIPIWFGLVHNAHGMMKSYCNPAGVIESRNCPPTLYCAYACVITYCNWKTIAQKMTNGYCALLVSLKVAIAHPPSTVQPQWVASASVGPKYIWFYFNHHRLSKLGGEEIYQRCHLYGSLILIHVHRYPLRF